MNAIPLPIVTIETETFDRALFDELLPLARRSWDECTVLKTETCAYHGDRDFLIEPDFDAYRKLSESGALVVVTLRIAGTLRGYLEGFWYRALHHSKIRGGIADSIYVETDYRAYTPIMIERFEKEMQALKVDIIGWPTHPQGPIYEVLKARGYIGDDIVMEKRLCVSPPRS